MRDIRIPVCRKGAPGGFFFTRNSSPNWELHSTLNVSPRRSLISQPGFLDKATVVIIQCKKNECV